jgi:molybdate transport system substrate-binding protein
VALVGCDGTARSEGTEPRQRTIVVFAASSLTGLLTDLAARYEQANPGLSVSLSFGSSTTLAQQIAQGAPADVFVSASTSAMAAARPRVTAPVDYLTNHVVVAVPAAATPAPDSGATILDSVTTWIQCAPEAPCGSASAGAITAFRVSTAPASLEPDAKSVVAKLLAGEADAGIVYLTDAKAAQGQLSAVEFGPYQPGSAKQQALSTQYAISPVEGAQTDADGFIAFLLSPEGIAAATAVGFGAPPR